MNFPKEHGEFLTRYQGLVLDPKLQTGTPREKADILRVTLAQLQYANLSGMLDDQSAADMIQGYGDSYCSIVDSFDEQNGLNNFAEGVLAICSGSNNDSKQWKSSLTLEKMKSLPCVQKLLADCKNKDEKLLPMAKKQQRVPCAEKENSMAGNICNQSKTSSLSGSLKPSLQEVNQSRNFNQFKRVNQLQNDNDLTHNQTAKDADKSRKFNYTAGSAQSGETVINLYGNQSKNQFLGPQETTGNNMYNNAKGGIDQASRSRLYDNKPLFSSGDRNPPWACNLNGTRNERGPPKQQYQQNCEDEEESGPNPRTSSAFRTARQQLDIDKQKKYGEGSQSRGPVQPTAYGTGKKSLGTRRGLNSKFVPPIPNREDEDCGNEAANTITRAVLKTGGGRTGGQGEGPEMDGPLKGIEPKMIELIMNEIMDNGPQLTWDDVAGLEFAKKTIKEIVVWPMLRPDIFTGLRGPPKGLLLFGPPGTGKTLIGKCIASQSKSTFFCISASSLTSKWVGEGEKMVRALFAVSRSHQPAVVFIDEIDSLLTQRTDGENEASRRIKTEFLVQLDGASTNSDDRLLVIGATNRPQEIDEAARRRFVKRLYIPLPELEARCTIVTNLLRQQTYHLEQPELDYICTHTDGFSGADMATLCREAALGPIRDMSFGDIEHIAADQVRPINFKDFKDALEHVRPSVSERDLDLYLDWNKTYGSGGR